LIYLDSSVLLAYLMTEDRTPPAALWRERLISSRLLSYEIWNRFHARRLTRVDDAQALLDRVTMLDLTPKTLARALEPFPIPVGTLDGLHLATIEFLRREGETIELASYDRRLVACAQALGVAIYSL
jgi:predicted nucleic acid-binding protein